MGSTGPKEISFERSFLAKVKKLGRVYVPPKLDPGAFHGLPDRVLCINGKYVALEMKRSMKEALSKHSRTPMQLHTLHEIQAAGGYATFVYPEIADRVFEELKEIANGRHTVR